MSVRDRIVWRIIGIIGVIMHLGCGNDGDEEPTKNEMALLENKLEAVAQKLGAIGFPIDLDEVSIEIKSPIEMASVFNEITKESKQYASFGPKDQGKPLFDDGANARLAFYNPNTKTIVFLKGATKYLTDGYLAHELTHVYQDQKWSFERIWHSYITDPSLELFNITQFMVEGHAELVREAYEQLHAPDDKTKQSLILSLGKLTENDCLVCRSDQTLADLPYFMGLRFFTHQYRNGGWPLVERAFSKPPSSTEQIMHPVKNGLDKPRDLKLPKYHDTKSGNKLIFNERLGEAFLLKRLIALKISKERALESASGWDGDIAQLYEDENGQKSLVWRIVFDRPEDAKQFEHALAMVEKPGETFVLGRTVDWIVSKDPAFRRRLRLFLSEHHYLAGEDKVDVRTTLEQELSMHNDAVHYDHPYFTPRLVMDRHAK